MTRRITSRPNQAAPISIQNGFPSPFSNASSPGPPEQYIYSMEEYQRRLNAANSSAVPQAHSQIQPLRAPSYSSPYPPILPRAQTQPDEPGSVPYPSPYPSILPQGQSRTRRPSTYSSPNPPIVPRQPSQRPAANIRNPHNNQLGLSNAAGAAFAQPSAPIFKKPALPAHAKPHEQSFLEFSQIISAVTETLDTLKHEVVTLAGKPSQNWLGLASRVTRLETIHTEAKVAGHEYFLAELNRSCPQNPNGKTESVSTSTGKFRLQLSVDLMNIGVRTKDIVASIKSQRARVDKELAVRNTNAVIAKANIKDEGDKKNKDIHRAWTVEAVEYAARTFFLKHCFDQMGHFSTWEEKARIEEETLPPPGPAGSWDDLAPESPEGSGSNQSLQSSLREVSLILGIQCGVDGLE